MDRLISLFALLVVSCGSLPVTAMKGSGLGEDCNDGGCLELGIDLMSIGADQPALCTPVDAKEMRATICTFDCEHSEGDCRALGGQCYPLQIGGTDVWRCLP